jgi:hypothetical protein
VNAACLVVSEFSLAIFYHNSHYTLMNYYLVFFYPHFAFTLTHTFSSGNTFKVWNKSDLLSLSIPTFSSPN